MSIPSNDKASAKLPVTVLIAAKNEAVNIGRCLAALGSAEHVILVDSHSTDATADIAAAAGAKVVQFEYAGGYPKKRQWALNTLTIESPWILLLDADEIVPPALWEEIRRSIFSPNPCEGYLIEKGFHFLGRRMRFGGFSHAALLLVRKGSARFERLIEDSADSLDMEIHERVIVEGAVGQLETPLIHEDFKGLEAYIARHNKYSTWEARVRFRFLNSGRWGDDAIVAKPFGNTQEMRRFVKALIIRCPGEPWLWFIYHYLARLGILEGKRGLIASQIRASYIAQCRAKVYEMRLKNVLDGHESAR